MSTSKKRVRQVREKIGIVRGDEISFFFSRPNPSALPTSSRTAVKKMID